MTGSIATLVLALAIILIAGKLGGSLAARLGQPEVLGELLAGIVLGNLALHGNHWFRGLGTDRTVDAFAQLGAVLLLFEVGVDSTVPDMLKVGSRAAAVALFGIAATWALGWAVAIVLLPDRGSSVHVFLGATLTATSVGITARVFRDFGRSRSPEALIVLGAAVIDDVVGLVILAVLTSAIAAGEAGVPFQPSGIAWQALKAVGFLFGALLLGVLTSRRLFALAARLAARDLLVVTALAFCFVLAYCAWRVGLAPIVGAFAAGLILEPAHSELFAHRGERPLPELLRPIGSVFFPIFFVVTGLRVDLAAFGDTRVLGLAALLTVAAVLGKQACALGALGAPVNRWTIALGMVPRGEVQLVFANIGLTLAVQGAPIFDRGLFSAVVFVVVLTSLVTPIALRWTFARDPARAAL